MEEMISILMKPLGETLYMVGLSTFFTILFGLPLGAILVTTSQDHIMPMKGLNIVLSYIVNVTRSFPFIILMISIIPFTKLIVGRSIGTNAAMVPLVLSATPFFARLVETSLKEIPWGVVEAALSMGANNLEIVIKVMIPEALSSIILGITTTMIGILGYSAMAGSIGGGGLGDLAITYGYQRYQTDVMIVTVIVLIVLVQIVQTLGNILARKFDRKN